MIESKKIIKELGMIPHREGGHFIESYRDKNVSLIYYLLKKNEKSHWHKLKKNEILHFYDGDPLMVFVSIDGIRIKKKLLYNKKIRHSENHIIIKKKTWFSMESTGNYSLIGCTVSPPFEYKDFKLAPKNWAPGKKLY